jgi:hypothetical protein
MEMSTPDYTQYPDIQSLRAQLHDAKVQLGQAQSGGSKSQFDDNALFCDAMKRINAVAKDIAPPGKLACEGNLAIGLFFDGTGNNKDADYGSEDHPHVLRQRKHSNVVRLYHVFPDDTKSTAPKTNKSYAFYIPGVGTPFSDIGDDSNWGSKKAGSAAAWNGEPRILWGLVQVLNAVHRCYHPTDLLSKDQAKPLVNALSIDAVVQLKDFLTDSIGWEKQWMGWMEEHGNHRRTELKKWVTKLKAAIPPHANPAIRAIHLSVFGFSRGSAEARAFVNWLLELCEGSAGKHTLAGIPIDITFLGLFETVASVGLAGMYSFSEGRQGWAEDNMQIPMDMFPVRKFVHLVGAHEARACFPLDSARIDNTYPPRVDEILYPGAHSDLGGGYMPKALGKDDWKNETDLQLARVPCFDMYCRAMAAGVPFYTMGQLVEKNRSEFAQALLPAEQTLDDLEEYLNYTKKKIPPGPVEDMIRLHMQYYHAWRWIMGVDDFKRSPEFLRIQEHLNYGDDYKDEETWVLHTQYALLQVITAYCREIDRRMRNNDDGKLRRHMPLNNTLRLGQSEDIKNITNLDTAKNALLRAVSMMPRGVLAANASMIKADISIITQRTRWLDDKNRNVDAQIISFYAASWLEKWRQWLANNDYPEIHDLDAEREATWLLEAVTKANEVSSSMAMFFGRHVHDSMAGFIGMGMDEFAWNGYGLGKYRRIFFGNNGDAIVRNRVRAENDVREAAATADQVDKLTKETSTDTTKMGDITQGL